jgi:hypothetical protein
VKRWLSEPLLHFLVAGALLFAAYAYLERGGTDPSSPTGASVRIGPGEVNWLRETWSRQWQREPTQQELRGLVTEYLKEELLAREARDMGLDQNDTIVRRRLAQKLEFLMQDTARLAEPSADDLERFYRAHPELFRAPARLSFSHVYFSRERRRDAAADARAALAELARADSGVRSIELGDRLMIESELRDEDEASVAAQFGSSFATEVAGLAPGVWHGPIESAYGLHLVRVEKLVPAEQRAFAEVREQVLERWRSEREREQGELLFRRAAEEIRGQRRRVGPSPGRSARGTDRAAEAGRGRGPMSLRFATRCSCCFARRSARGRTRSDPRTWSCAKSRRTSTRCFGRPRCRASCGSGWTRCFPVPVRT